MVSYKEYLVNISKQSAIVDLVVDVDEEVREPVYSFLEVLEFIEMHYHLQRTGEGVSELEGAIFQKIVETLRRGTSYLSGEEKLDLSRKVDSISRGIYDLCSLILKHKGEDYIDLIIGKILSWDKNNRGCYSGAVGLINKSFDNLIESYDKKLDYFQERLPVSEQYKGFSIKKSAPLMRCIDVFSLAGELNIRHKPICVFFSGGASQNLSTLSRMTVFINMYVYRFKLISNEIARKYLEDYSIIKDHDDSTIARLLLVWLRGHMRYLADDLLKDDLLIKAYIFAIAEMFRYIRRGRFYNYPDTASAFLAYCYFRESGSIRFDTKGKKFTVDFGKLETDLKKLTEKLLTIFAEGDVTEGLKLLNRWGDIKELGQHGFPNELEFLEDPDIPHYIDFNFVTRDGILSGLERR